MEIQLRLAQEDDVPALHELIKRSVRYLSEGYYTPRQVEIALEFVFGVDTQLIEDGTYYVAETEGLIVGCGGWSRRSTLYGGDQTKEAEDRLLDPATEPARIRAFFVDPDFARRGIGRRILAECEKAASEAGFSSLELGATLPGEPLYASYGFHVMEWIDHPMPGGEVLPVVLMGKQIS